MPYIRFADIQKILTVLDALSEADIVARCSLPKRNAGYVPIECLIHMLRRGLRANNTELTNSLFTQFMARLRRVIPLRESEESLVRVQAYEQVQDRLVTLFAKESTEYQERLDFFEIRFDGALARLLQDARKKASKEKHRKAPLVDEETGEIDPQVEKAAGAFDPFDPENISDEYYRSVLDEAMEELPTRQKRIIEMTRNNVLIDSQDPNVQTIVKTLGLSEKTVRNQRNKAIVAIKEFVKKGEK